MRHILAAVMVGALLALTTSAALAGGPSVEGSVTQVFTTNSNQGTNLIAVNGMPYAVPLAFYLTVHVGNIVQFDGTNWTIVQ